MITFKFRVRKLILFSERAMDFRKSYGFCTDLQDGKKCLISSTRGEDEVDYYYSQWFHQADNTAGELGTQPSVPRICKKTIQNSVSRSNYRRTLTIPFDAYLNTELEARFLELLLIPP